MINVFVANFSNLPAGLDPNSARFLTPSYTYPSPVDDRAPANDVLQNTPCVSPGVESRCIGNLLQTCQTVNGASFYRTIEDCASKSAGGNYVQMCQKSTGKCCTPGFKTTCQ
jgi:hypothetical protein